MLIEKRVTITISGDEVETLSKICDCARIYMENNSCSYNWRRGERDIGQFAKEEVISIAKFTEQVFDS